MGSRSTRSTLCTLYLPPPRMMTRSRRFLTPVLVSIPFSAPSYVNPPSTSNGRTTSHASCHCPIPSSASSASLRGRGPSLWSSQLKSPARTTSPPVPASSPRCCMERFSDACRAARPTLFSISARSLTWDSHQKVQLCQWVDPTAILRPPPTSIVALARWRPPCRRRKCWLVQSFSWATSPLLASSITRNSPTTERLWCTSSSCRGFRA
mmetsp:Transcript_10007/g.32451  ORF Transcript_10007/g.32451 Transcript_10007/m.32451 type:complete len:209 (+) Transcript_10007:300-926(+)